MELIFATNNIHKLYEVRQILSQSKLFAQNGNTQIKILSLADVNCKDELPETSTTLEGNAWQKAIYVYHKYHLNCFADDTGLEIEALGGRPGVYSARYAGENCNPQENIKKVLLEMKELNNRRAKFRTIISFILNGKERLFEGNVNGIILKESRGNSGFGYDPIFAPYNEDTRENDKIKSFAEMSPSEKNHISHRAKAIKKFAEFLLTLKNNTRKQ